MPGEGVESMAENGSGKPEAPVKFGFSLGKKAGPLATKKVQEVEVERRDLVTAIAGNRIESVEQEPETGPLVIPLPKVRNVVSERYKSLVRRRPKETPPPLEPSEESPAKRAKTDAAADAADETAADKPETGASADDLSAFEGENREAVEALLRQARGEDGDEEAADDELQVPLLLQNRDPRLDLHRGDDAEQFRADVASRPDEASIEAYERIPIDAFGTAMLRGMNWAPGKPVGLTNKAVVNPTEFVKRAGFRTGLGAQAKPDLKPKKKRVVKPGDPLGPQEPMVLPLGPDGRVRHVRSIDEKLVPLSKRGIHDGSRVSIVGGPHEGLVGRVVRTDDAQDQFTVRLEASNEDVVVAKSDLSMVHGQRPANGAAAGSDSEESGDEESSDVEEVEAPERVPTPQARSSAAAPPAKATPPSKASQESRPSSSASERRRESRDGRDDDRSSKHGSKKDSSRDSTGSSSSSSRKQDKDKEEAKGWLRPHLVVRVVSKSLENGRFYLKKGVVVDVIGPQVCTVQVDGSRQVVEAKQRMLETVIPKKANQKVMIVEGPDRGRKGRFMEKSKEKDEERAVIQLAGSLSVKSYSLDFVCEFSGDDGMD